MSSEYNLAILFILLMHVRTFIKGIIKLLGGSISHVLLVIYFAKRSWFYLWMYNGYICQLDLELYNLTLV